MHENSVKELVREASRVVSNPAKLIDLIAGRMEELKQGAAPRIPGTASMRESEIALRELIAGKVVPPVDENEERRRQLREFVDGIAAERLPALTKR